MTFAAIALSLALAAPAADDKPDPLVALVKSKIKDPTKPFVLVVHASIQAGKEKEFEAAFAVAHPLTRKEAGNMSYDLTVDPDKAGQYMLYEKWKSLADFEKHMKTDYTVKLLTTIGPMFAAAPDFKPRASLSD